MKQLPKKWCIKGCKEFAQWIIDSDKDERYGGTLNIHGHDDSRFYYLKNISDLTCWHYVEHKNPQYTEITFEQFKQHFMKEEKREIIGYKLVKRKFERAVDNIIGQGSITFYSNRTLTYKDNPKSLDSLKEAGVLDLWFEPVYKEEKQLPKINGYEGKVTTPDEKLSYSTTIEYGCAVLNVQELVKFYAITKEFRSHGAGNRKVVSIKLDTGVEITMDQIKQIVEYFTTD